MLVKVCTQSHPPVSSKDLLTRAANVQLTADTLLPQLEHPPTSPADPLLPWSLVDCCHSLAAGPFPLWPYGRQCTFATGEGHNGTLFEISGLLDDPPCVISRLETDNWHSLASVLFMQFINFTIAGRGRQSCHARDQTWQSPTRPHTLLGTVAVHEMSDLKQSSWPVYH